MHEGNLKEIEQLNQLSIIDLEDKMLDMPQAEVPVIHHFGPDIYIREVRLCAGLFAIGHHQKNEHYNIMIEGEVMMFNESGTSKIKAPMMFVGQSGRKMGYILKDTVWLNVYSNPTNERNIDVLESMFLEKSDVWEAKNIKEDNREDDVKDFDLMVLESGFDKETIEKQSKNEGDQIEMNEYFESKASVRDSNIHGIGLFATSSFHKGEMIGPARINGKRTIAGRYVNHAKMPNCIFKKFGNDVFLFANEELKGCHGGDKGTELTVDYRQALELSGIYLKDRG